MHDALKWLFENIRWWTGCLGLSSKWRELVGTRLPIVAAMRRNFSFNYSVWESDMIILPVDSTKDEVLFRQFFT